MAFRDALFEHKDTLLRGATLLVGGAALVLAGSFVGLGDGRVFDLIAGLVAVGGVVTMFLAFFIYLLPPLLPNR